MHMKFVLAFLLLSFGALSTKAQIITTYAGNGTVGYSGDGGQATAADLSAVTSVFADVNGNIYLSDPNQYVIRKIAPSGIITTIAGVGPGGGGNTGDGGQATLATLFNPQGVFADSIGNVYFIDSDSARIRKINTSGIISTIAGTKVSGYSGDGGAATAAQMSYPNDILMDKNGNIYFTDVSNYRVRKISSSGIISTVAGTGVSGFSGDGGPATAAQIGFPYYLTIDRNGNLYFGDDSSARIRKVSASGIISTVAGTGVVGTAGMVSAGDGGPATAAVLGLVYGMTTDNSGNLYYSEAVDSRIRKIDFSTGIIKPIVGDGTPCGFGGDGGTATLAKLCVPEGISFDKFGNLYISDYDNHRIRRVKGMVSEVEHVSSSAQITLSPNPATAGAFTLNINTGIPENAQITITNVTGSTVSALQGETNKAMDIQLNAPKGLYFVTVTTSHGVWVEKVVVD